MSLELIIEGRPRDLGGFEVRRVLPSARRRMVGPFIFFDHMGPVSLPIGQGLDVRPHPHIGLATVTYLFEGEIIHRDSLGSLQAIRPGDVNWMEAGRGIVHSERSSPEARAAGVRMHGIQSWVALPLAAEEGPAAFVHHPQNTLPKLTRDGATIDVIAGDAYGARAPVKVASKTFYAHVEVSERASLPLDDGHEERAIYVVEGRVGCRSGSHEQTLGMGSLGVFVPGARVTLDVTGRARFMLLGGAPLEGPRYIDWNFVSSSEARLQWAKDDWRNGRFAKVPGDEAEFIPLPADSGRRRAPK